MKSPKARGRTSAEKFVPRGLGDQGAPIERDDVINYYAVGYERGYAAAEKKFKPYYRRFKYGG